MRRMEQKVEEAVSHSDEIDLLAGLLSEGEDRGSFVLGVMVGRVYNSFYYQTKRILDREPTPQEFEEFVAFLAARRSTVMDGSLR